jgi:S1-C subfamily serine protease
MVETAATEKHHQTAIDSFASGLRDSISSPIDGAAELFGAARPQKFRTETNEDNSTFRSAGEILGSAVVFIATTGTVKRFLPGAGRLAPIMAGGILGGVSETPNGTIGERLTNAALGAGTVSLLEFAPGGLSKLGVNNKLGQLAVSNAAAGMFNTQAESFMKTGHAAGFGETLLSGGTWSATGMAFAGGGKLFESLGNRSPKAKEVYTSQFTEIPGLKIGERATPESKIEVAGNSHLATLYDQVKPSIGRAEVLAYNEQGGMEGRFGTVFSADDKGRLITANHVSAGAVDVTVFDSNHRPHKATVVTANEAADVSVLQLKDPSSYKSFKPLPFDTRYGAEPGTQTTTFGHPSGWRNLFASPGVEANSARPHMQLRFQMHGLEGLSGAPVVTDQGVKAVFVQGARSSPYEGMGTPIKHAEKLLEVADRMQMPSANADQFNAPKPKLNLELIRSFNIHDKGAARANLDKLFGEHFSDELPAEFFHSKVKTVPLPGTESGALTMSMQYQPSEHKVVISPIAIDKAPISAGERWAQSQLTIDRARLEVQLGKDGLPTRMVSYNDPWSVLQQGFNYRGENNYLATLQQTKMPRWMQLLPAPLRFERLATGS